MLQLLGCQQTVGDPPGKVPKWRGAMQGSMFWPRNSASTTWCDGMLRARITHSPACQESAASLGGSVRPHRDLHPKTYLPGSLSVPVTLYLAVCLRFAGCRRACSSLQQEECLLLTSTGPASVMREVVLLKRRLLHVLLLSLRTLRTFSSGVIRLPITVLAILANPRHLLVS